MTGHILLLDNNERDRQALSGMLEKAQHKVSCPEIDGDVLMLVHDMEPDVLITDMQVGTQDFVEVVQELRPWQAYQRARLACSQHGP